MRRGCVYDGVLFTSNGCKRWDVDDAALVRSHPYTHSITAHIAGRPLVQRHISVPIPLIERSYPTISHSSSGYTHAIPLIRRCAHGWVPLDERFSIPKYRPYHWTIISIGILAHSAQRGAGMQALPHTIGAIFQLTEQGVTPRGAVVYAVCTTVKRELFKCQGLGQETLL